MIKYLYRATETISDSKLAVATVDEIEYSELLQHIQSASKNFSTQDCFTAGNVVIYLPNGMDICAVIWAAIHSGITAAPIEYRYTIPELASRVAELPEHTPIITTAEQRQKLESSTINNTVRSVADLYKYDAQTTREPVETEDEKTIFLLFTSGTSGDPKAVELTHSNVETQVRYALQNEGIKSKQDSLLLVRPIYHISGLLGMTTALCNSKTLHIKRPDKWDPAEALRILDVQNIAYFHAVTKVLDDLMEEYKNNKQKYDINLEHIHQGGMKLSEAAQADLSRVFDCLVTQGYGQTETTGGTHNVRALGNKFGSVGQPYPYTAAKIVNEDGEELEVGEEGELVVNGPQVMKGYYNIDRSSDFDELGYFHTGDIAYRDEENYYYILGRKDRMANISGYNVHPGEIDTVIKSIEGVKQVATVVLSSNGEQLLASSVILTTDSELTSDRIREVIEQQLVHYKQPESIVVTDAIPGTGSGSVKYDYLKKKLTSKLINS